MKIQVLGSGCSTCKQLFETTKKITKEMGIDTEVEYVTDVSRMIEMGVMTSPVLAVDGKPALTGGGKSEEDIKNAEQSINNGDCVKVDEFGTRSRAAYLIEIQGIKAVWIYDNRYRNIVTVLSIAMLFINGTYCKGSLHMGRSN